MRLGNVTAMHADIRPMSERDGDFPGGQDVSRAAAEIRTRREILRAMDGDGARKIVGPHHDPKNGQVPMVGD